MTWRMVVPVCVSLSYGGGGGGFAGDGTPPPLRAKEPPSPPMCTCRAQMSAMEAHGLKSERYARSQPEKGFLIRKLVQEVKSGKGCLIRKGFLKWGSR